MSRWDGDEIAWARECFAAGDTVQEIAQMAGRDPDDVRRITGRDNKLSPMERQVLSLYACGLTFAEIDAARGVTCRRAGAASSMVVSRVRLQKRVPVPYRQPECAKL